MLPLFGILISIIKEQFYFTLSPYLEGRRITDIRWFREIRSLIINDSWSTLFRVDVDNNMETELISGEPTSITRIVQSPNSYQIATALWQEEQSVLYLIDVLSSERQVLLESELNHQILPLSWSPDGEWLAFSIEAPEQIGLYLMHLKSGFYYPVLEKRNISRITSTVHPWGHRFSPIIWID